MSLCWRPLTIVQLFQLTLQYAWSRWGQYFDISGWCCRGKWKLPARQHLSETRADIDDSEDAIFVFLYADEVHHFSHKLHWCTKSIRCLVPVWMLCLSSQLWSAAVLSHLFWFTDIGHIALLKELLVLFCQTSAWLECFHQCCINLFFLNLGATVCSHETNVITFAVNVIHLLLWNVETVGRKPQ